MFNSTQLMLTCVAWSLLLVGNTLVLLVITRTMRLADDAVRSSSPSSTIANRGRLIATCGVALLWRLSSMARVLDAQCVPLVMFLAANLLTGLVNMNMHTRTAPVWLALLVLASHAFASLFVAAVFRRATARNKHKPHIVDSIQSNANHV